MRSDPGRLHVLGLLLLVASQLAERELFQSSLTIMSLLTRHLSLLHMIHREKGLD